MLPLLRHSLETTKSLYFIIIALINQELLLIHLASSCSKLLLSCLRRLIPTMWLCSFLVWLLYFLGKYPILISHWMIDIDQIKYEAMNEYRNLKNKQIKTNPGWVWWRITIWPSRFRQYEWVLAIWKKAVFFGKTFFLFLGQLNRQLTLNCLQVIWGYCRWPLAWASSHWLSGMNAHHSNYLNVWLFAVKVQRQLLCWLYIFIPHNESTQFMGPHYS